MTIAKLSASLKCSRADFEEAFEQARRDAASDVDSFKMHAMGVSDNTKAFTLALAAAEQDGWLPILEDRLLLLGYLMGPSTNLQGVTDAGEEFQDPLLLKSRLSRLISQVCLIKVANRSSLGSGFLVGPNAVLTSWHVIQSLLDEQGKPKSGSHKQISVRFDHVSNARNEYDYPVSAGNWLTHQSPCHPSELASSDWVTTNDFSNELLKDHLDYAIISLAACPGNERGFVDLSSVVEPEEGATGHILQHPEAFEQKIADGQFGKYRPGTQQQRLLYSMETRKGSSGGMIVDQQYNFVGLHQGEIPDHVNEHKINTGISGKVIFDKVGAEHLPDPSTVLQFRRVNNDGPIIGRDGLQEWIHRSLAGHSRIAHVFAANNNKGASFSSDILKACIPEAENRITVVSAGSLSISARQTAAVLLRAMGITEHSDLPDPIAAETTDAAWIKAQLLPVFRERVNKHSLLRVQWLVIDNIDKESLPDTGVRLFLSELYSDIVNFPNLRIILIGLSSSPPGANISLVHGDEIGLPDNTEIDRYLRMSYTRNKIDFDYQGGEVDRMSTLVVNSGSSEIASLDNYVKTKVDPIIHTTAFSD